jgi:hypothetical protein
MKAHSRGYLFLSVLVVGAPLVLAVIELFHPQPHDLIHLDTRMWLIVHYLQIPLFPLAALAACLLLRGRSGFLPVLVWTAMFVFAVSFTAFDTAAGVVTGILTRAAQSSGSFEAWQQPLMTVWRDPIVGGAPGTSPLLAVLGSIAWSVGLVGVAVDVWRTRRAWIAVLLLVISAFGLSVFRTHAWPGGPVSFGALAVAAAWIEWKRAGGARSDVEV